MNAGAYLYREYAYASSMSGVGDDALTDEYKGMPKDAVIQQMQEIWLLIYDLTKETHAPGVVLKHSVKEAPEVKADGVVSTHYFTYKRAGKKVVVAVHFDADDQSLVCTAWQAHNKCMLRMLEYADVRGFVVRRLAPRLCICLSANDMLNMIGHLAKLHTEAPAFEHQDCKVEHDLDNSYFVFRSGADDTILRMRLTGKDLLVMEKAHGHRTRHDSGPWTKVACYTDDPINMDEEALSKADNYGDFQDLVQVMWGQIMLELGMQKLLLPTSELPVEIQEAVAAWRDLSSTHAPAHEEAQAAADEEAPAAADAEAPTHANGGAKSSPDKVPDYGYGRYRPSVVSRHAYYAPRRQGADLSDSDDA